MDRLEFPWLAIRTIWCALESLCALSSLIVPHANVANCGEMLRIDQKNCREYNETETKISSLILELVTCVVRWRDRIYCHNMAIFKTQFSCDSGMRPLECEWISSLNVPEHFHWSMPSTDSSTFRTTTCAEFRLLLCVFPVSIAGVSVVLIVFSFNFVYKVLSDRCCYTISCSVFGLRTWQTPNPLVLHTFCHESRTFTRRSLLASRWMQSQMWRNWGLVSIRLFICCLLTDSHEFHWMLSSCLFHWCALFLRIAPSRLLNSRACPCAILIEWV